MPFSTREMEWRMGVNEYSEVRTDSQAWWHEIIELSSERSLVNVEYRSCCERARSYKESLHMRIATEVAKCAE